MKFSIERAALLKAVAQAQSVVERRNTIPILANVLIEAQDSDVRFRATDLDIEVVDRADAQGCHQLDIDVPVDPSRDPRAEECGKPGDTLALVRAECRVQRRLLGNVAQELPRDRAALDHPGGEIGG